MLRLCDRFCAVLLCGGLGIWLSGGVFAMGIALLTALLALLLFPANLRVFCRRLATLGGNETVSGGTNEILAPCFSQRFANEREVFLTLELEQRALHRLIMRIARDIDTLAGAWIDAGIEHAGGQRTGRGIEILNLFGLVIDIAQVFCKLNGGIQIAARMAGNEIGDEVLFLPQLLIDALIFLTEGIVHIASRFAHNGEHFRADMLRRDLELATDVVLAQLLEEGVGFVRRDVVIAQTTAHEDLFHLRQGTNLAQEVDVVGMIDLEVGTGLGEKALTSSAGAIFHLLFAAGVAEICCWTADIVDIPLEPGHFRNRFGFLNDGFMAASGNDAPLKERDRAEGTGAKAAARMRDGELHFFDGGNTASGVIIGVPRPLEGESVYIVQLLAGEGRIGNSLNNVSIAVLLADCVSTEGILLIILHKECVAIFFLASYTILIRRNFDAAALGGGGGIAHASHLGAFPCRGASAHPIGGDEDRTLAHAEHEQICAAVNQDARANGVIPIIIMRETAKGRLYAADSDWNIAICLANQTAIDINRAIGTACALSTGGIDVGGTALLRSGIMVHHAVDHASGDEKSIIWSAKTHEIMGILPAGLGEHGDAIARALKNAAENGTAKGRMIHICVAADENKIGRIPTANAHVAQSCRGKEKAICHKQKLL